MKLVVSPVNGAVMQAGAHPKNTGGKPGRSGRPKDDIRERLQHIARGKGLDFLDQLLDGEIRVRFVGVCPNCHQEAKANELDAAYLEQLGDLLGASVEQRLKANEQALKYGIGTQSEKVDGTMLTTWEHKSGEFWARYLTARGWSMDDIGAALTAWDDAMKPYDPRVK